MKMLFVGTHGSESPTHALLPFLSAQGAIDEGHEVELLLMGDAVVLMHAAVAKNTIGVGWPSVAESFGKLIEHKIPVYVWGGCSVARGVTEADLQGKNATFINPRIGAQRMAAAERVITY